MEEKKYLSTLEQIKAFSDPYRLQILTTYRKFERPATVKEIADKLKETPAKVHYHVKKLEKAGILVLVNTKEINGIIAKYYEPTAERFIIKHKEHDKELSKVILSESQRVISNLYENSRKDVIDQIVNRTEEDLDKKTYEFVRTNTLYLTKEEARDLNKYIDHLCANRRKNDDSAEREKYHLFGVLFPLSKENID